MRATSTTVALPLALGRRQRVADLRPVPALAFAHVAYHRTEGRWAPVDGRWTVTHLASSLAIATDLPTQAAARSLALTCERDVTAWPTRDQDGGHGPRGDWANVAPLRDTVRLWRIRNVGGYALVRASPAPRPRLAPLAPAAAPGPTRTPRRAPVSTTTHPYDADRAIYAHATRWGVSLEAAQAAIIDRERRAEQVWLDDLRDARYGALQFPSADAVAFIAAQEAGLARCRARLEALQRA